MSIMYIYLAIIIIFYTLGCIVSKV